MLTQRLLGPRRPLENLLSSIPAPRTARKKNSAFLNHRRTTVNLSHHFSGVLSSLSRIFLYQLAFLFYFFLIMNHPFFFQYTDDETGCEKCDKWMVGPLGSIIFFWPTIYYLPVWELSHLVSTYKTCYTKPSFYLFIEMPSIAPKRKWRQVLPK